MVILLAIMVGGAQVLSGANVDIDTVTGVELGGDPC